MTPFSSPSSLFFCFLALLLCVFACFSLGLNRSRGARSSRPPNPTQPKPPAAASHFPFLSLSAFRLLLFFFSFRGCCRRLVVSRSYVGVDTCACLYVCESTVAAALFCLRLCASSSFFFVRLVPVFALCARVCVWSPSLPSPSSVSLPCLCCVRVCVCVCLTRLVVFSTLACPFRLSLLLLFCHLPLRLLILRVSPTSAPSPPPSPSPLPVRLQILRARSTHLHFTGALVPPLPAGKATQRLDKPTHTRTRTHSDT